MIIPLEYAGLPEYITRSARVLYANAAGMERECRNVAKQESSRQQSRRLEFRNIARTKETEGWAAVTCAVSQYYNQKISISRIHTLVKKQINNGLLPDHAPSALDQGLRVSGHHRHSSGELINEEHIKREINNNRPVCIRLKWDGAPAEHFAVIYGYTLANIRFVLHVADPWDGYHDIDYEHFSSHYKAKCTGTYLTSGD